MKTIIKVIIVKITAVEARAVSIPYKKPFTYALGTSQADDIVVVRVSTDKGSTGVGEVTVDTPFYGETLESIVYALEKYVGPNVIGNDPFDIGRIVSIAEQTVPDNSCAICALDLALFDLIGKSLELPVYSLLGGKYREKVSIAVEVGMDTREEMVKDSLQYVQKGFRVLKFKVGGDPVEEAEKIEAIREEVGETVVIRADANQAWSPYQAIQFAARTRKSNLELFEQPVPKWDIEGLAKVTRAVDVPVMADESVFSPSDAVRIVRRNAADILNVKLPKAGGLYNAKKITAIAEAAGLACIVGSAETLGIGTAAKIHLACSIRNLKLACEATEFVGCSDSLLVKPYETLNGFAEASDKPGYGVEIDNRKLAQYGQPLGIWKRTK